MTDYTLLDRIRQRNVAFSSPTGRVLFLISIFIVAEATIFFQFVQTGLIIHTIGVLVLFWLIFTTENSTRAYEALVFVPVLRLLNFGTAVVSEQPFAWLTGVYLLVLLGLYLLLRGHDLGLRALGLDHVTEPADWLLITAGIIIGVALGGIQWIFDLETPLAEPTLRNAILIILVTGLLVGFVEEVLFRGLLQPWVAEITGTSVAVVTVSILFGFMHSVWLNPLDIAFAFSVSLLLGGVYARTRNFWFIASVHSLINITAFAVLPLLLNG